jgi:osmotically-inducible protein OsmY
MFEKTDILAAFHNNPTDDERLAQRVRRAIEEVEPLRVLGFPIRVQANDGVVTLRGVVASYPIKEQALEAVLSVRGVQCVRDKLRTDLGLEIRIARALLSNPRTHRAAFGITVNSMNGLVSLAGRVLSREVAQTAEELTAGVPGVRAVSSRLKVVS